MSLFNKLIAVIDNIIYKSLFQVLYFCGLRKDEALALSWSDVDFSEETIKINKSINQKIKGKRYVVGPPKNKSSVRDVKLDKKQ